MQHAGVKAAVASWNKYVHFHRVAERTLRSMLYITLRGVFEPAERSVKLNLRNLEE